MSDLYSGLIQPYLRKGQNGEQFWGLYNSLDGVQTPQPADFLKVQIAGMRALESSANYDIANAFLKSAPQLLSQEGAVEDLVGDEVYARIFELLNAGLRGSSINPYKNTSKGEDVIPKIQAIILELQTLLNSIGMDSSVSSSAVLALQNRLMTFDWNNPTPHNYIMAKANFMEELMAHRINQNPALRSIVTGAWTDSSGKQLIEDALTFAKSGISIPFKYGNLKFTINTSEGSSSRTANSIGDFLNQLDALNGEEFKVSLSDELYEELRLASVLSGQAKSGAKQAILNDQSKSGENARNAMSLGEAGFDPMLLWNLFQEDMATKTEFFKPSGEQDSATLEALANYSLSKSIADTNLKFNKVYLTAEGFVSASDWIESTGRYLVFKPGVRSVEGDFLIRRRPYAFTS